MKSLLIVSISMTCALQALANTPSMPSYLKGYEKQFAEDPRAANLAWLSEAKYGLFLHFGLYSMIGNGEWIQIRNKPEPIPLDEYGALAEKFTAENFDAEFITDFAMKAGMKYINITAKHHDGYSLFDTQLSEFKTTNSPCGRDLIKELYEACERKGLALFLYYSYAADWKHPYFYPGNAGWKYAQPTYKKRPAEYKFEKDEDFENYIEFADGQVKELLTMFPNIAGIWFDPIMGYYGRPDLFRMEETYAMVRETSPHALISFKQGATGSEDFIAPERHMVNMVERVRKTFNDKSAEVAKAAWEKNQNKLREICNTMHTRSWGYKKNDKNKTAKDVIEMHKIAHEAGANLLLNIGPLPDGSLPQENIDAILEATEIMKKK
ncbi:MAG: alpha-L-fucosidase [Verrucomicrobiota bacterium]